MSLTLLQMVQQAQAELGLPQSATVIGNTGPTTVQMLALANRCLDELRRCNDGGWTALQFEYNLVVNPPLETTGHYGSANTAIITNIPSTATLAANYWSVSGPDIPQAARIQSVTDATTVVMTMEATNTAASVGNAITFSQDTFPLPDGFDFYQNRSWWDRTNQWELIGPDSPQIDQWHRSGIVTTGPRRHFRQIGPYANTYRIWPPPMEITSPLQLVFEYISKNAVMVAGSQTTFAQYFANDTDQVLLDDQAIIMGIKWMFWEIKGMGSYVTLQGRWVDYVDRLIGRDGGAQTLQLAKQVSPVFISPANVQDGFFPGPTTD